jgi:hypothetical protein
MATPYSYTALRKPQNSHHATGYLIQAKQKKIKKRKLIIPDMGEDNQERLSRLFNTCLTAQGAF